MELSILLFILLAVIFLGIGVTMILKLLGIIFPFLFWGAIYVPTTDKNSDKMLELLSITPGQKVVDLGAGDGRLIIAMARKGAEAHGYEINPFLVTIAKKKITEAGLEGKAFMYCKNLWKQDISSFDSVAIYAMKHMVAGLEKKFEKELKPGAKVVSNYFTLPSWKPVKSEGSVYLYIKN
jgi:cyclopropane fatty-acyl-phospholipid synthase-like methyltransferase